MLAWKLTKLVEGRLEIVDGLWCRTFGQADAAVIHAQLNIYDTRTYRAVIFGGTIGAADAYAQGWWSADDLTALIRIMARNRSAVVGFDGWLTRVAFAFHQIVHRLRSNRKVQNRRNISAHYDLGNDFFSLFLDSSMTYSCAVFPTKSASLKEASKHKLDLVCQKLALANSDHLLEIGTGWGSLAIHAAQEYGCRVTTTTISRQQYEHAQEAVASAGLTDRVTVLNVDYRELPAALDASFEKVVSIEMIEAVGYEFLDQYFTVCNTLTKPGGRMLLQAIVIADELYSTYIRSVDMIQRYIFPGGFLPSVADMKTRLAGSTDFRIDHLEDITAHYPLTLRCWRERFLTNWSSLEAQGYPEHLLRMWEYYFCYCEGGFLERTIGDVQLVLTKPKAI